MKTEPRTHWMFRSIAAAAAAAFSLGAVSCTTTYDYYGRPQQTVDPGAAVAGAAVAGLAGYAIARDRNDRRYYRHHHYGPTYYQRPSRYYYYR